MPIPVVQCAYCRHFNAARRDGDYCTAFPFPPGIPLAIITGEHDHRKPFTGDNGIRFEAERGQRSPFEEGES